MQQELPRSYWLAALVLPTVFCGSYIALRAQRTLVRTGQLYNCRTPGGALAPGGGWMNTDVRVHPATPERHYLEVMFWPPIRVESLFWDTLVRRLRTDTRP